MVEDVQESSFQEVTLNTLNINYIKNKHKHIENEQVDEIIEKMIKFSGGDKMKNTFGFNISKE
jgi:hypothetical protein